MALSRKAQEAFVQYSKKMCTRVTIFWMIYRTLIPIFVLILPQSAEAFIRLTEGVDTAMIINMSVYTFNSSTEKIGLAYINSKKQATDTEEEKDEEEASG